MEHSLVNPLDYGPRRLTLLLGTIAGVEALVILAAAIVFLAKPIAHHLRHAAVEQATASLMPKTPKTGPTTPPGKPQLSRTKTSVLVLNGNGVTGAAATAAAPVRQLGYRIKAVGNAHRSDYPQSVVMYKRGYRAEGMRLGRDLNVKIVGPLDGIRVGEMQRAQLAYVIGG